MRNFLFYSNPLNMFKRRYWSPQAIATRLITSIIVQFVVRPGIAYLIERRRNPFILCPDCEGESNRFVFTDCGTCGCAGIVPKKGGIRRWA